VALDQEYFSPQDFSELYDKADAIARIISGFITSLLKDLRRARTR
jgi:hypothetical protein